MSIRWRSPFFLNGNNLLRTTSDFMEIGHHDAADGLHHLTGNIDLSIASTLGLSASLMGWLFMGGWNIWLAVLVALVVSALAGPAERRADRAAAAARAGSDARHALVLPGPGLCAAG